MRGLFDVAFAALSATAVGQFSLSLFTSDTEAKCLDGSPAGYYFKAGDPSVWIISMQGGGWCWNPEDCLGRANTSLGSSKFWAAASKFGGLLDTSQADNPDFYNATMVLLPYCDGASFSGYLVDPLVVSGTPLFMRGHTILTTVLDTLVAHRGMGAQVQQLIVMGGSAGGLSTFLHVDYISSYLSTLGVQPRQTSAFPDCGFFLAAAPDVFGRAYALGLYQTVVDMQNATGSPQQVDADCWYATPPSLRWQCFIASYTYPHISTPLFLTNSQYDAWQLGNIWAPPGDGADASYGACIKNPLTACNATQYASFQSYHVQFQSTLNMSLSQSPQAYSKNGGFLTSCVQHGEQEEGLWNVIAIGNVTMRDAMSEWYYQKRGSGAGYWRWDVTYPGNDSCP